MGQARTGVLLRTWGVLALARVGQAWEGSARVERREHRRRCTGAVRVWAAVCTCVARVGEGVRRGAGRGARGGECSMGERGGWRA